LFTRRSYCTQKMHISRHNLDHGQICVGISLDQFSDLIFKNMYKVVNKLSATKRNIDKNYISVYAKLNLLYLNI
jgi:ribosome biogenesis protein Nip4